MSLKLFLLLLLGLVLLTTSTLAGYDSHHPPRGGVPYRPPKHGPPHLSEDTLPDENLPLDGRGGYQKRPPYKKKPPVVETEGKGEYGNGGSGRGEYGHGGSGRGEYGNGGSGRGEYGNGGSGRGEYGNGGSGNGEYGRHDEPKPRPRHDPIYGDPRNGDGPKKPPHKPPLEN